MFMAMYSFLLTMTLVVGSPWWLWRMVRHGRYREGLSQRLGRFSPRLVAALRTRKDRRGLVWVHACSVGEVLGAEQLIRELQAALPEYLVVVSTTTRTGQEIAERKLGEFASFYLPLDFAFAVRRYLRLLQPSLLVLVENERWPRLLRECERRGIAVAQVNARVSDRGFNKRAWKLRLERKTLERVTLYLTQGEESAERFRRMGVDAGRVRVSGNLKYDAPEPKMTAVVERLRAVTAGTKMVLAGSTLPGEEAMLLAAWEGIRGEEPGTSLVIAPRQPYRFQEVRELLEKRGPVAVASEDFAGDAGAGVVLLDTLGDLAVAYGLAAVAFVGGSLIAGGGHNPLEAARFGVPVMMGASYENFREIVNEMKAAEAIRIVGPESLGGDLLELLRDGAAMGERGRQFFRQQTGATRRTVEALLGLLGEREG